MYVRTIRMCSVHDVMCAVKTMRTACKEYVSALLVGCKEYVSALLVGLRITLQQKHTEGPRIHMHLPNNHVNDVEANVLML
jgi:hypothetical protein